MYARISTIEGDPAKIDDAVAILNESVIPTLKAADGFKAANFMVDRSSGKLVGISFWDSAEALEASAGAIVPSRNAVADAMAGKIVGVESLEMVAQSW